MRRGRRLAALDLASAANIGLRARSGTEIATVRSATHCSRAAKREARTWAQVSRCGQGVSRPAAAAPRLKPAYAREKMAARPRDVLGPASHAGCTPGHHHAIAAGRPGGLWKLPSGREVTFCAASAFRQGPLPKSRTMELWSWKKRPRMLFTFVTDNASALAGSAVVACGGVSKTSSWPPPPPIPPRRGSLASSTSCATSRRSRMTSNIGSTGWQTRPRPTTRPEIGPRSSSRLQDLAAQRAFRAPRHTCSRLCPSGMRTRPQRGRPATAGDADFLDAAAAADDLLGRIAGALSACTSLAQCGSLAEAANAARRARERRSMLSREKLVGKLSAAEAQARDASADAQRLLAENTALKASVRLLKEQARQAERRREESEAAAAAREKRLRTDLTAARRATSGAGAPRQQHQPPQQRHGHGPPPPAGVATAAARPGATSPLEPQAQHMSPQPYLTWQEAPPAGVPWQGGESAEGAVPCMET